MQYYWYNITRTDHIIGAPDCRASPHLQASHQAASQLSQEGGLGSGGKDNTKQTNELLLRAFLWALPVL